MLKKRIIACLIVSNGVVVQSIGFKKYLPIGKPKIAVEFLNNWGVDEIIIVDIKASMENRGPDFNMIKELSSKCHVPIAVGGGITSIEQMRTLMDCGADKIVINQAAIIDKTLIGNAARVFGNQCIVVSIDVKKVGDCYKVFDYKKREVIDVDVLVWCKEAEKLGAGEIFLTSVDRDGTYMGYDIDLFKQVSSKLEIPVIASGGAGNGGHFADVFKLTAVNAASAGNFFHFSEHSVIKVKSVVKNVAPIRLDTAANYADFKINDKNRLMKRSDQYLKDLLYLRIDKEII